MANEVKNSKGFANSSAPTKQKKIMPAAGTVIYSFMIDLSLKAARALAR